MAGRSFREGALAVALAASAAACSPPIPPCPCQAEPPLYEPGEAIVVVSDTQRTTWAESVFLGREQNETARRQLVQKIASENPAFVVHLGDMVNDGGDRSEWEYFDRLMAPIERRKVPILPTLGNHETWGDQGIAEREEFDRFPDLTRGTFYSKVYRGIGLVWLNSNLHGDAAKRQAEWFDEQLCAFERNETINGVLVFTHHPPFTDGICRPIEEYVSSVLLPKFDHSRKAVAFISGHVHGYERFEKNDKSKEYIVTGGGGGPRVRYHAVRRVDPLAVYRRYAVEKRAFNYVVIDVGDTQLEFTVKCIDARNDTPLPPTRTRGAPPNASLQKPLCEDGILERFTVPLPKPLKPVECDGQSDAPDGSG
jgi:hypothetical protein